MRHGSLVFMLPLCAATLIAVVALAFLVASQSSKIDAFLDRAPVTIVMPEIPPDETKMETAWCYKTSTPPSLHTTITVKTTRNPGESIEAFVARHMARVAEQQEVTPDNCPQH